eukprot:s514_g5.t1
MHFDPKEQWASTEEGRQKLLDALMEHSLQPTLGVGNHDPATLPRRHMPPGTYSDLFRLYQAECLAQQMPAASASTFFRVLKSSGWKNKIKFRGSSTHAQCKICHQLKSKIRTSKDVSAHAKAADLYMRHLGGVFADRQVYAQSKIRAKVQRDILCCIVDSMDKSKYRLPRFAQGRTPKPLENKKRPELEFTTCIMHGHSVNVFLADAEQSSGSDWWLKLRLSGVAVYLDDERKEVLLEVASYLEENYDHYGRAVLYIRQLAGLYAMPRTPPPRIEFLLMNHAGLQRGAVVLPNAEAMDRIFNMECVAKHAGSEKSLVTVPMTSVKNIFLELPLFSFAENAKYGEFGRWPATHLFKAHFPSFLENGFEAHREPLDVKFDLSSVEPEKALYEIKAFSAVSQELLEEDEHMCKVVASLRMVKCNYKKHSTPEGFLYETLSDLAMSYCTSLANRTAEKVKPSALDLLLLFRESVRLKQASPNGKKSALRDLLFGSIADYNKSAWRVTDTMRKLIYNLLRSPKGLWDALKICYNESKPQDAALTMENMDGDFFVVGTELVETHLGKGKLLDGILDQWKMGRPENERLIVWVNYVTAGVVSGKKLVFTIEQVTQLLHSFPRTGVAVILLPNRASDLRKDEKDDADEDDDEGAEEKVRPISIFFDPATTYGTREGFHSALLVTSNERANYFTKMPVYKSGVVSGVGMLPRAGTLKLPGFPEFEQVIADLKKNNTDLAPPDFQVCVPVPNGVAIKQNLIDYWSGQELFQVEMQDLLQNHNVKYNPHGVKRGADAPEGDKRESKEKKSSSLLQRCELGSSSDDKSGEDKVPVEDLESPEEDGEAEPTSSKPKGRGKGRGKTRKEEPEVLKKPAIKKKKKTDEFDDMFADFLDDPDDEDQEGDDSEEDGGAEKKKKRKKLLQEKSSATKGKSTEGKRKRHEGEDEETIDKAMKWGLNKTQPAEVTNESDLVKAEKVVTQALDSYVTTMTAESQGRIEVQEALEFQTRLANGSLLESSAEKEKDKVTLDDDEKTLILGEDDQDRWALQQNIFPT